LRTWRIALVGTICQALGIGLLGLFSFYVQPLAEEFGVGVGTINIGAVFMLVAPAFVGPVMGRYLDSHSIRTIMLTGAGIAVTSLLLISRAPVLWLIGLAFFGYAVGAVCYGPLVTNALLVKAYPPGRAARALSIAAMGTSIGSVLSPFGAAWLLGHYSWRTSVVVIAAVLFAVLFLSLRLGLPHRLEGQGVRPLGPGGGGIGGPWLRTRPFWLVGIAVAIIFNGALMVGVSYAPHFSSLGFDIDDAALFIASGGIAGFLAKLLVAAFADTLRTHVRGVAVSIAAFGACGFLLLLSVDSFPLIITATLMIGASGGAFIPLHPFLNSVYFPASIMGRINGAQTPLFLPLGLVASPLAGFAFDRTGSFSAAYAVVVALFAVAALLLFSLPRPDSGDYQPQ
jgi:MFS family permease